MEHIIVVVDGGLTKHLLWVTLLLFSDRDYQMSYELLQSFRTFKRLWKWHRNQQYELALPKLNYSWMILEERLPN